MNTFIERPDTEKLIAAFALIRRAEQYYQQQLEAAGIDGYARVWCGGLRTPHVTLHTHGLRLFGDNGRHNSTWKTFRYGSAEAIQGINEAAFVQTRKIKERICRS